MKSRRPMPSRRRRSAGASNSTRGMMSRMLKSKPVGMIAETEKMPFQITPFVFYLTRQGVNLPAANPGAVAVKLDTETKPDTKP